MMRTAHQTAMDAANAANKRASLLSRRANELASQKDRLEEIILQQQQHMAQQQLANDEITAAAMQFRQALLQLEESDQALAKPISDFRKTKFEQFFKLILTQTSGIPVVGPENATPPSPQ